MRRNSPSTTGSLGLWIMVFLVSFCTIFVAIILVQQLADRLLGSNTPSVPTVVAIAPTRAPKAVEPTATPIIMPTKPPTATSLPSPTSLPPTPTAVAAELSERLLAAVELDRDGLYVDAFAAYNQLISEYPEFGEAYYWRAAVRPDLQTADDYTDPFAEVDFEELTEEDYIELAATAEALTSQPDETELAARADYELGKKYDPNPVHAAYQLARLESSLGNDELAIQQYNEALRLDPTYAQAYYSRAIYYRSYSNTSQALQDFSSAIKYDPTLTYAYAFRGKLWESEGNTENALRDYDAALAIKPNYYGYYYRGLFYKDVYNNNEMALADLDKAVALRPQSVEILCDCAWTASDMGDHLRGIAYASKAIEIQPDYACAYYTRGSIHFRAKMYGEAAADYTAYIDMGGSASLRTYTSRARAYGEIGKFDLAMQDLDLVFRHNDQMAYAYETRGYVYKAMGNYTKAREDWLVAADLYLKDNYQNNANAVLAEIEKLP